MMLRAQCFPRNTPRHGKVNDTFIIHTEYRFVQSIVVMKTIYNVNTS